jgi:hypothetical protein
MMVNFEIGYRTTVIGIILDNNVWTLSGTLIFSKNKNKVLDLGNTLESGLITNGRNRFIFSNTVAITWNSIGDTTNILAIGHPVNVFYGYKTDGIIQTLAEGLEAGLTGEYAMPGEYKYVDLDKKGAVDENDKDVIGDPNPDFTAVYH